MARARVRQRESERARERERDGERESGRKSEMECDWARASGASACMRSPISSTDEDVLTLFHLEEGTSKVLKLRFHGNMVVRVRPCKEGVTERSNSRNCCSKADHPR